MVSKKSKLKGGDGMGKKSTPVEEKQAPVRGRPQNPDRGEIVISNGLYARQWDWIQREAAGKVPRVDAAWLQRWMIDVMIDMVEASRAGPVATPEQDATFDNLVKQTKQTPRNNNSNRRIKK